MNIIFFNDNTHYREESPQLTKYDPHVVASVLKSYLRELPDHVLTSKLLPDFEDACSRPSKQEKIQVLLK